MRIWIVTNPDTSESKIIAFIQKWVCVAPLGSLIPIELSDRSCKLKNPVSLRLHTVCPPRNLKTRECISHGFRGKIRTQAYAIGSLLPFRASPGGHSPWIPLGTDHCRIQLCVCSSPGVFSSIWAHVTAPGTSFPSKFPSAHLPCVVSGD